MSVVAWVGAATALLGATMGVTQFNLKKVLAYSTISQIGLMVLACGVGAFSSALFHLLTHAFFKACLFLAPAPCCTRCRARKTCATWARSRGSCPFTFATFLVAALALCGVPPFAGFFSKDEILWQRVDARARPALWLCGRGSASALTSFYMFRAVFMTFFGASRGPRSSRRTSTSRRSRCRACSPCSRSAPR